MNNAQRTWLAIFAVALSAICFALFNSKLVYLVMGISAITSIFLVFFALREKGNVKHFSLVAGATTLVLTIVAGALKYSVS